MSAETRAVEDGIEAAVVACLAPSRDGAPATLTPAGLAAALSQRGITADVAGECDSAEAQAHVDVVTSCDVVVVGSGAGGGVCVAMLARAGLKVLVVEKGAFVHASKIPGNDTDAFAASFEQSGGAKTLDTGISIYAGSGVGGGTRVNWCASFCTPLHVREEWAKQHGVDFVASECFTHALDTVCARLGVHTDGLLDKGHAAALVAGSKAAGATVSPIPQNCLRPGDCTGRCGFGCAAGGKQDTARTWLADGLATGRVTVLTAAAAERVLTETRSAAEKARTGGANGGADDSRDKPRRATGLLVAAGRGEGAPRLLVRARAVVICAGSLHSPALLLRSGIRGRGNVGRHLRLHPATIAFGFFPRGTAPAPMWDSPMMSAYRRDLAAWDAPRLEDKYGPMLSVAPLLPFTLAASLPFRDGRQVQADVLNAARAAALIVYTRDGGAGGRVKLDADAANVQGSPLMFYKGRKHDFNGLRRGLVEQLRTLRAAGATRLLTAHNSFTEFNESDAASTETVSDSSSGRGIAVSDVAARLLPGDAAADADRAGAENGRTMADARFEKWLERVAKQGCAPKDVALASAHQMGTCRMGRDADSSVVDAMGESWQVEKLYVADASLFPTATGVNPMVTIEALAYCVAENVATSLTGAAPPPYPTPMTQSFDW